MSITQEPRPTEFKLLKITSIWLTATAPLELLVDEPS